MQKNRVNIPSQNIHGSIEFTTDETTAGDEGPRPITQGGDIGNKASV